jgi:predicted lipoprotein
MCVATRGDDRHGPFQEARMSEAKSNEIPVGSAFAKQAELLMSAQGDVLTGVETMITGWAQRQRQVFEASSRSMQRICEARNMFDLLQAQHEWLSDCLNWTASEIRAVGNDIPAITRKATERFGDRGNGQQRKPPARVAPNVAAERAAAE